ncbi:MAG: two-component system, NarL family, response regulator LiaR [Actinomycetota bacterium]|nr:two-component system, NarL family, response regulator LiaR [Actinomycetota bacterium]
MDNEHMPEEVAKKTVLLVDDHPVVREGLRLLLETVLKMKVIEASSGPEALSYATGEKIDVVLLDARMPDHDGIWTLKQLREAHPQVPVLMLSTYDTEEYVDQALASGASGYLLKESTSKQLFEAIDTALSGRGVYLHPSVAQRVLARGRGEPREASGLSERELDVLKLLARGSTNDEIAEALFISEKTVKSHLSSIFRKLRVTNRTQAASKAIREKLVQLSN